MPVIVKLIQGNLTHDTELFPIITKMNPYVYITIGGERRKSTTCRGGGRNPSWTDVFTFENNANDMQLKIEVWDKDTFTRDDLVGDGVFNLTPFANGAPANQYVSLTYKGKEAGNILLGIQFTPKPNMMNPNIVNPGRFGVPIGNMQPGCPNNAHVLPPTDRQGGCKLDPWDINFTSY